MTINGLAWFALRVLSLCSSMARVLLLDMSFATCEVTLFGCLQVARLTAEAAQLKAQQQRKKRAPPGNLPAPARPP